MHCGFSFFISRPVQNSSLVVKFTDSLSFFFLSLRFLFFLLAVLTYIRVNILSACHETINLFFPYFFSHPSIPLYIFYIHLLCRKKGHCTFLYFLGRKKYFRTTFLYTKKAKLFIVTCVAREQIFSPLKMKLRGPCIQ